MDRTYDDLDRVIEEENELGQSRLFTLDAAGNLTSKIDRNGRETEYTYDDLYRNLSEIWWDEDPPAPSGSVSTTTTGSTSTEVQSSRF